MDVWIVGEVRTGAGEGWSFLGVFDSESEALSACIKWEHFVARVQLGRNYYSEDDKFFDECWYPVAESKEEGLRRLELIKLEKETRKKCRSCDHNEQDRMCNLCDGKCLYQFSFIEWCLSLAKRRKK